MTISFGQAQEKNAASLDHAPEKIGVKRKLIPKKRLNQESDENPPLPDSVNTIMDE